MEIKDLMTRAVDQNIICYDSDAQIGHFTKRLISLMKVILRKEYGDKVRTIFVDIDPLPGEIAELEENFEYKDGLTRMYLESNGGLVAFPEEDTNIVLVTGTKNTVLLGSF